MIHLVVLIDKERIEEILGQLRASNYPYTIINDSSFLVYSNKTSKEFSEEIGIYTNKRIKGTVVQFKNYYGYASKDLWEWVDGYER